MNNLEIRQAIADANIRQWQVAEEMGIREDLLSRKMRHELQPADKAAALDAIERIKQRTT